MTKKYFLIAIIIFVSFLSIFYLFPNFLFPLESLVHDSFINSARIFNLSSPHLKEIVIVALDDISFWRIEKKWPYSRAIYADLLNKISIAKPKLVIFDIVFRGESENKQDDELLAKALQAKDNVLLPYHLGKLGVHIRSKKDFTVNSGSNGYINKPVDEDGIIRKFHPLRFSITKKIIDYAAEVCIFSRYYNYDLKNIFFKGGHVYLKQLSTQKKDAFKKLDFPLSRDNSIWLNYQAKSDDFKTISMFRILSGDFKPEDLKDKVILIGTTADIFHDIHNTPLGLMPGTSVMANVALMFLDGRFIYEAPEWFKWLAIFFFCLFLVFYCYRCTILKGLLLTVAVITVVMAASFWLFLKYYYFNPFRIILICVVTYIAINFYRYASVAIENMQLRKLSTMDELTGLYTFRFFQVVINHEFQKCLRYKTPLSLLMIDIDNFKKINDTHGHQKGNIVLHKIGEIILKNVRTADFPTRYGGEELAILLPNSNVDGANKCAENLRKFIEKEDFFMTSDGPFHASVSIGLSSFPSMNIISAEEMIKFADTALYKAKREGKNRVVVFSEGM